MTNWPDKVARPSGHCVRLKTTATVQANVIIIGPGPPRANLSPLEPSGDIFMSAAGVTGFRLLRSRLISLSCKLQHNTE